jgi:cyclopropane fatty-acyl-phospholipid synthase-like methyltransferase
LSRWFRFESRYLRGRTPWDTGITPPEVMDFLAAHPPGRAIDFGCGTGTNAMTLARRGWEVVGIDFSHLALVRARRKARAAGLSIRFLRKDVCRPIDVSGPFDLALDIGCLHGLPKAGRPRYAATLSDVVRSGGTYLLYTVLDEEGDWATEAELTRLLASNFDRAKVELGEFDGQPSAWFTWQRR